MGSWYERLHERIESPDGPSVIAYWDDGDAASEQHEGTHKHDWHRHLRGQLYCVDSGLVHVRTRHGSWMLPPHRAGWMPPGELHTVSLSGPMTGWGLFLVPAVCQDLPGHPCVIGVSGLMRELVRRASDWALAEQLEAEQRRVSELLLDELRRAPHEPLYLPMPTDRRLLRVAEAVLKMPHDNRSLEAWAECAGLSMRSLSRLFRSETAMSFAQWRQQARLSRALERLAEGMPVAQVAESSGYASVSAFVAMFRRNFGQPPARYFAQRPLLT